MMGGAKQALAENAPGAAVTPEALRVELASRCSSAACGCLAHAKPHPWSTACDAAQLRAVAWGAQAQAKQALAQRTPGVAAPEVLRAGLATALQLCNVWHAEHCVARELHWYSGVPTLYEQMQRKVAQEYIDLMASFKPQVIPP